MDPLELIHSVERLNAAQDVQSKNLSNIVHSTDTDNVKKIEDEVILHQSQVEQTNEKEALDPDDKGNSAYQNNNKKHAKQNEEEPADNEEVRKDEDKGNILDIEA